MEKCLKAPASFGVPIGWYPKIMLDFPGQNLHVFHQLTTKVMPALHPLSNPIQSNPVLSYDNI